MKRFLLETVIGIIVICSGLYLAYLSFEESGAIGNFWMFTGSTVLIIGGIVLLGKAGTTIYNFATQPNLDLPQSPSSQNPNEEGFSNALERNNAIAAEYADINKKRDQLKVLEISGAAKEQASQ